MKFSPDEREKYRSLTARAANGPQLAASPKLKEFLDYVVDCALRDCPEEASEQQIGVNVFGRTPGYNSSEDSIVRAQARLLRQKLSAYFQNEGSREPEYIEIPKGHYLPVFRQRPDPEYLAAPPSVTDPPTEIVASPAKARPRLLLAIAAGIAAVIAGVVMGYAIPRPAGSSDVLKDPLWGRFFSPDRPPLVIYSNPVFHGTPKQGLRLDGGDQPAGSGPMDDTYTGTGEVQAVYALTRLFDNARREFLLKRSRLVTWDDARSRNLVFLGASTQNTALGELPESTHFVIRLDQNDHGYIVNEHPAEGEPRQFVTAGDDEYAIIALLPGLEPSTRILIFTGLTTVGTQAAVEFACDPAHRRELAERARREGMDTRPFEAVLRVPVRHNVGLNAEIVAFHQR